MKIIRQKKENVIKAITFCLPKELLSTLTQSSKKHEVSRQKLVTAILETAVADKNFKLEIKE